MKEKLKMLLEFALCFVLCFAIIYLFVFVGGWKLFESGDPILIEIGVSLISAVFLFGFCKAYSTQEKSIKNLEDRVDKLETYINEKLSDSE